MPRRRSHSLTSSAGGSARAQAATRCEIVCCVTPGAEVVIDVADLRAGLHLNMLGADGPGKAEATIGAVASCALFCDEWEQASHGGELTGAIEAGLVKREQVSELGAVLAGEAPGRPGEASVTLFDSTGTGDPGPGGGPGRLRCLALRGGRGPDDLAVTADPGSADLRRTSARRPRRPPSSSARDDPARPCCG